jgi:CHAT domain-containing protein
MQFGTKHEKSSALIHAAARVKIPERRRTPHDRFRLNTVMFNLNTHAVLPVSFPATRCSGRPQAPGLATLLAGLLWLPLGGGRALASPSSRWLAQSPSAPASSISEVNEPLRQAEAFEAKGAYAEAARLWQQILAIREKELGPAHPDTATSLNKLAGLYSDLGRYAEAEPLYRRTLAIREKTLGADHRSTATTLNDLAELFRVQGRYGDAEPLYKRSLAVREKTLGLAHPATAASFNNLAVLYKSQGRYGEAELFHKRSLAIREKALGPDHPDVANSLNNLAVLYESQGRYGEAEPVYKRSLAIREKTQGPEHPDTATSLNNLAGLYQSQGRYAEAEPLYKRTIATFEKVLGPEHPSTATSLTNLAAHLSDQGRYGEAEPFYQRSLGIKQKALGPEHPSTATSLNNLAVFFESQGRYGEAEPLYKRTIAIFEKLLGPEHPSTATSLTNLAGLYRSLGRFGEAEILYKRSLGIKEKALGAVHPDTAISLNNLAELYQSQGRYAEAEFLTRRSLAIDEKALGPEHPSTAISLTNLAALFSDQGRYGEAEPVYKRSLAIREKALNPEHPDTANSLHHLAVLYYDKLGRYGEAEPLFRRSLAIREKALGPEHPDTANSLINLGLVYLGERNGTAAEPLLQRLNQIQASWLRRELPLQPRDQRSALINQQEVAPAAAFALLDQRPTAAPLALETRLNRQGLLAEIERRQALLKGSSPDTRRLAEQVAGIDRLLASVSLPQAQREPLRQRRQQLEAQLYRLLPSLKIDPVSNAQVAAALKAVAPQGLLLEFQRYRPLGKGPKGQGGWGSPRYVALLLRPDGTVGSIPLGAAEPIDAAIAEAVAASADPNRQQVAPDRLEAVSQLLLKPLQPELAGVRDLFVSPDGELNRLPFAALPMAAAKGPTLGESVQLRLLTTGRELVRLQQPAKTGNASTMIMNPDFGPPDPSVKNPWQPLESTAREARELAPLLKPHAVISGRQATTAVVLQLNSPRILHIATHGFFLADEPDKGQGKQGFEALQRSGLVFAGANQRTPNPADDGYLTAAEATAINLDGTELVTLSACETALGGVQSGEGVYGLQRALAVAGARSTLLSLWKVEDGRTATFLARYYEKLRAGQGRAEALRKTQIEYRKSEDTNLNDVRVWGAFQLSGDWRPIRGW